MRWALGLSLLLIGCTRAGFVAPPSADSSPRDLTSDGVRDLDSDRGMADGQVPIADGQVPSPDIGSDALGCPNAVRQVLTITSGSEDGEINGVHFPQGETQQPNPKDWLLYLGYWEYSQSYTWGYFRFALQQPLPASARVQAHLRLWGKATSVASSGDWDSGQHALRIFLEDSDNASAVTTAEDAPDQALGRPTLGTSVRWPANGGLVWATGATNETPDLGPLLTALVQQNGGLASGANLQLWIRGDFEGVNAEVATCDRDQPDYVPATLEIAWCE